MNVVEPSLTGLKEVLSTVRSLSISEVLVLRWLLQLQALFRPPDFLFNPSFVPLFHVDSTRAYTIAWSINLIGYGWVRVSKLVLEVKRTRRTRIHCEAKNT